MPDSIDPNWYLAEIEYVDSADGKIKSMHEERRRVRRERPGAHTTHFQRPNGDYRVVLRYGYKDVERIQFTQKDVLRATRRRLGIVAKPGGPYHIRRKLLT